MTLLLAASIAVLFGAGVYMMMRRSIVKLVIGLALLGHAANLLIYLVSGLLRGRPALIDLGEKVPDAPHADPLPAALILTAIVIGFGLLSFTLVLVKRVATTLDVDDLAELTTTDR